MTFSQWVLMFTLYSMLGWLCESAWCSVGERKLVNRGFLGGPWCPIYGFGAIIILLSSAPLRQYPLLVFLVAMLSTSLLEYFTGWLLEALFKTRWWDYSDRRFQIKGRVCLFNSLLFGLLGVCAVYFLQPLVSNILGFLSPTTQRVLASVIVVIFFFDLLRSLAAATNLEERLQGLQTALAEMERYQKEHDWYHEDDIDGSIAQLQEICASQPDNELARDILAHIQAEMNNGRNSVRLVKAFPSMRSRSFSPEFSALQAEWARKHRERRRRVRQFWASLKQKAASLLHGTRLSYKGVTFTRMVWVFLIGSVIGYVVETLFCLVTRGVIESRQGMIYGPFNQVYGFGAVLMVLLLTPFARYGDGWVFVGGAVIGGLFEAACSVIQESLFGSVSWEYSEDPFSMLGGRTSLVYMLFWGILAVLYMKFIYPPMARLIDRIPLRPKRFFTWVIVISLSANMLLSALAVNRWSGRLAGVPAQNNVETWLDEHYKDDMLKEIYPNMQFTNVVDGEEEQTP